MKLITAMLFVCIIKFLLMLPCLCLLLLFTAFSNVPPCTIDHVVITPIPMHDEGPFALQLKGQ